VAVLVAALGAVLAGMALLWTHAGTPGQPGDAPTGWPAASTIVRAVDRPTLVLFAHPRCPCTRASLGELRRIVDAQRGRVDAQVWVVVPDGAPADWSDRGELVSAADIPGVAIHFDHGGAEAKRFGAHTSGQVVLYDAVGRLRYQGGVTGSRGHAGDNDGEERLLAQLQITVPVALVAPVFGCDLLGGARP